MSSTRSFFPTGGGRAHRLLALALLCVAPTACRRASDLPDLAGWTGEPQVAAKIREVRDEARAAPESAAAVGRLGMVFHAHELHAEAIACYRKAAGLAPEEVRWPYLAALATAETDLEGSLVHFARAVELDPAEPAVSIAHGDVLVRLGRFAEADERYRAALALDSGSSHALLGLARSALGRGEEAPATELLERAAAAAPHHGEVQELLARVYQRLSRPEDAERARLRAGAGFRASRAADPHLAAVRAEAVNSRAYTERGQRLAEAGRFAEAETELRRVLEIRPGNARDHSNLGGALAGQGKLVEAVAEYRKALAIDPDDTYALNNLGLALAGQGDLEAAAAQLARAIEIDSTYADAHRNLGLVRARQSRPEEAIAHYRAAIAANPSLARAHNDLGTALAQRGALDDAVEQWRQALAVDPRELSALYNLAIALVQKGEHREAIDWLRHGLETAPNSSRLVSLLAWELATAPDESLRDPAAAERLARRVFEALPDQPQMGDVLAAALAAQGRFEEAAAVAEGALELARDLGQSGLEVQIGMRLKLYRRQRAWNQSLTPASMVTAGGE